MKLYAKFCFLIVITSAAEVFPDPGIPQDIRDYFIRNSDESSWFSCPAECDCMENLNEKSGYELTVSCYKGNLSHNVFSKIIKESPRNITSLIVEAPSEMPNYFLWTDDLNRFKKLRVLRLINCGIPALSHSINLRKLEILDVRLNNIEEITIDMFTELPNLKRFDLSRNRLRVLPTGVFAFLHRMESLSLAYNEITDLPITFLHGQRTLKVLHLDGNKISVKNLNSFLRDTQQLERLELNYCGLQQYWNLNLEPLKNLRRIGLAGNFLGEMPTILFRGLTHLEAIDLSDNDIRELVIDPLWNSNITQLFLSDNHLNDWHQLKNIAKYGPIKELDISYNNFPTFTADLLGPAQKTIEILNLSGNQLRYIDDRLTNNMTLLKALHLADNEIVELPPELPPEFSQLTLLNLSKNALYSLPYSSEQLFPSLQHLDISQNRFYTLQASLIEDFINHLDRVYLYDNPWDCGCNIDLLKRHMSKRHRYKKELKYYKTRCLSPEALRGTVVLNLHQITDCAVLFGARYGFTQATELGVLLALLLAISMLVSLIILFAYYRKERRQKISYIDAHRSHSRTALTLSQHISRSPSSVIEPLTSSPDDSLSATFSTKIPPPPPPPILSNY